MDARAPLEITLVKSSVSTKGTRSRLKPSFFLKCPKKCPKSIWKSFPSLFTIILSGCRSPMPRINVATQKPAHDFVKFSIASSYLEIISLILKTYIQYYN